MRNKVGSVIGRVEKCGGRNVFPWLKRSCIYIAVSSRDTDTLWYYRDRLCDFAERNHYKIEVVLTTSKGALLQSIRPFNRKPDFIIVAAPLNLYQYQMFIEQLEGRRSRAKVFFMGTGEVLKGYEKKVISVANKAKLEWYLEREMDWLQRKRLWRWGERSMSQNEQKTIGGSHVIRKWSDNETE